MPPSETISLGFGKLGATGGAASEITRASGAGAGAIHAEAAAAAASHAIAAGADAIHAEAAGADATHRHVTGIFATHADAIHAVSDEEILSAYDGLAREGLFCEPASAASVAGLRLLARTGRVERGQVVVCVLTGHGLKDPEAARSRSPEPIPVEAEADAVAAELGL